MAKEKYYLGTGYLPRGPEAQIYKAEGLDLGLIATAEVTLAGLHADETLNEKELPKNAFEHKTGPKNQICLATLGMNTMVKSWVPSGEINGMIIRHGEAFGISDRYTVWEKGKAVYRPTVHYAYCPSDSAINSLHEL